MSRIFISGFGDIGHRVANIHLQRNDQIYALVRSKENPKTLQTSQIHIVAGDLDDVSTLIELPVQQAVLYHFAPPPPSGEKDIRLQNLLTAIGEKQPKKIVLISTTAVYGDCQGNWITEDTPVNPQTDRGKRRLHAEQLLSAWAKRNGITIVILRVGGIYGPQRLPVERLKKELPILKEELSPFTNRIHEDDLANICVIAADKAPAGAIYNVSDGKPGTMSRYFKDVAAAMNLPQPKEVDMDEAKKVLSAGMLSYLQESRRIDNSKLINELKITLQFPDFETGLAACMKQA